MIEQKRVQELIEKSKNVSRAFDLTPSDIEHGAVKPSAEEIEKREFLARPVLYQRDKSDELIANEISESNFLDLKSNVIDIGACVLCGACEYICPDNLITIDDTKPIMKGYCPQDCHGSRQACAWHMPGHSADQRGPWRNTVSGSAITASVRC